MNSIIKFAIVLPLLWIELPAETPAVAVVADPQPLTPEGSFYMAPSWAPDGSRIAVTGSQFAGIHLVDFPGGAVYQLTDEPAAGSGLLWSPASELILTTVSKFENRRRYNAVTVIDVVSGEHTRIVDYATGPAGSYFWTDSGHYIHLIDRDNRRHSYSVAEGMAEVTSQFLPQERHIMAKGEEIIYIGSTTAETTVIPTMEGRKLNLVLSPGGAKLAFEIVGGNLWITDFDGNNRVDLGRGNRPSWNPTSDKLAYIITEDDGHRILASDIYVVNADGTGRVNITQSEDVLEMHPAWSPDGRHIAYDDFATGRIFVIEVR